MLLRKAINLSTATISLPNSIASAKLLQHSSHPHRLCPDHHVDAAVDAVQRAERLVDLREGNRLRGRDGPNPVAGRQHDQAECEPEGDPVRGGSSAGCASLCDEVE